MSHLAITCKLCGLQIQRNSRTSHKIKCSENVKEKVNFFVTNMIIRLIGRTVSFDTKKLMKRKNLKVIPAATVTKHSRRITPCYNM